MGSKDKGEYLKREEVTIRSDIDSKDIFHSTPYYAGDSVDQHKQLEEVNEMFSEKEIKQSNENS
ncbi:hypothetical protein DS745_10300 [Anaerobacillus alkaliphilus]|uniref:DUF4025 domain-containing protein n=1 Tax=Anaerobacillus alkaliphilus TaxID=1548597 RepID=A0A4Q0VSR3_9BACI|nr:hypothetical protein [Anaerobacillus alkaliphilus]RXJ01323.1 hypothetical protein DS745_10300 [Anaerobacillus alkaliphilus]